MGAAVALLASAVPAGRVFGLDQQTAISIAIQLLNACILAAALSFILYKPVREFMRKRTDQIGGQFADAEKKMAQANALKAEYEKRLEQIDVERHKILESARTTAAERSKHILDEARHEALIIKRRTEESVAHERERLKEETRQHIIEVSASMAGKFMEQAMDEGAQDRLFREAMAELEEATWQS